ncbi:MAG: 50S ribosomal protein L9 [Burkholderiales bacterium]
MQIILLEKIHKLGSLGDIVKVREGYGRNYLIPKGKAKRATPQNLEQFEKQRADLEKAHAETLAAAQQQAQKMEGLMLQITQHAGPDGKLFGSVTNADISRALKAQNFSVERSAVRLPSGSLKQVGDFPVTVVLHTDVSATITVSVLGEG